MENSFIRLKHYRSDKADLKENHATECLAGCLKWSPALFDKFLQLLFPSDALPQELQPISEIEILTQEPCDGGFFDLVLAQGSYRVVIEVKVGSPEDQDQLKKYLKSLGNSGKLFTLVQTQNQSVNDFIEANGIKRITWTELHKCFSRSDAEIELSGLRDDFCNYLEQEGIVTIHESKDLASYDLGLKATSAVKTVFERAKEALRTKDGNFEAKIIGLNRSNCWPRLEVEHPDYKRVFGDGSLNRVWAWFMVPGIWGAEEIHDFYVEIELWNREFKADWAKTRKELSTWEDKLKKSEKKFVLMIQTSRSSTRRVYTEKSIPSQDEPCRIFCYPETANSLRGVESRTFDETVEQLVKEIQDLHECILKL